MVFKNLKTKNSNIKTKQVLKKLYYEKLSRVNKKSLFRTVLLTLGGKTTNNGFKYS